MAGLGFDGLKAFWDSMTVKQRAELVKNLNSFHGLKKRLELQGIIRCNQSLSEITILKKSPEIKKLKNILKKTGAMGIKFIDGTKKKK